MRVAFETPLPKVGSFERERAEGGAQKVFFCFFFFLVKDVEPVGARALHPQNTTAS